MARSNLRVTLDAFTDNVKEKVPSSLIFDGKRLYLNSVPPKGRVGITSDLTDDTCYRITGDDVDDVAGELGVTLTGDESARVQRIVGDGFSDSWHDIVEIAIDQVIAARQEV